MAGLTNLESTLTEKRASVDSKPLTRTLSSLDATLTKNQGGVGSVMVNQAAFLFGIPLVHWRPLTACLASAPSSR